MPMDGCRHSEGGRHDCDYVEKRNALIPKASRMAWERVEAAKNAMPGDREKFFDVTFHAVMNELAAEAGLCQALVKADVYESATSMRGAA